MPPMPPMPPLPPSQRRATLIAGIAVAVVIALSIGVAIGRATVEKPETPAPAVASSERGKLKVISTPEESNVTLDGRFVGVAPLEGLDVDPGKHTVVVDVFGYQPYSGTIEVEKRGNARLTVVLAPLNAPDTTTGNVSGGTATRATVPRSALLPAGGGSSKPADAKPARPDAPARVFVPQRPRRDCSGENYTCTEGCRRASTDCDFSCPGCSSCNTSTGWDECKRQCDACRRGCEQNKRFCESSCSSQKSNCEASQ